MTRRRLQLTRSCLQELCAVLHGLCLQPTHGNAFDLCYLRAKHDKKKIATYWELPAGEALGMGPCSIVVMKQKYSDFCFRRMNSTKLGIPTVSMCSSITSLLAGLQTHTQLLKHPSDLVTHACA